MSLQAEFKRVLEAAREDPDVIRRVWDAFQEDVEAGEYDGNTGEAMEMLSFFKGQSGGGDFVMPKIDQLTKGLQSLLQPAGQDDPGMFKQSSFHDVLKVVGEQYDGDPEKALEAILPMMGAFGGRPGAGQDKLGQLQMFALLSEMGIFDILAPGSAADPNDTSWGQVVKGSQRGKQGLRSDSTVDWQDFIQSAGGGSSRDADAIRNQERDIRKQIERMQKVGPDYAAAGGDFGSKSDAFEAWQNTLRDLQVQHRGLKEQYQDATAALPAITMRNAPGFEGWEENKRNQPDPKGDLQRAMLMEIMGLGPEKKDGGKKQGNQTHTASSLPRRAGIGWGPTGREFKEMLKGPEGPAPEQPSLPYHPGKGGKSGPGGYYHKYDPVRSRREAYSQWEPYMEWLHSQGAPSALPKKESNRFTEGFLKNLANKIVW